MRIVAPFLLAALLTGCSHTTGTNGDTPSDTTETTGDSPSDLNLDGTWTGSLTIATSGGTFTPQAVLTLAHSGSTVTGSMVFDADTADTFAVTGTLTETVLTTTLTPPESPSDDCHLFPVTLTFDASATALTATGGSGEACDGDGMGGHSSLDTLTAASGTLTR